MALRREEGGVMETLKKKHGIQRFCHFEVWADPNHTVVSIYI
jgi:hypothetical protein